MNKNFAFDVTYFETHLTAETAELGQGFEVVSVFVSDHVNAKTLKTLHAGGTKVLVLRSAGFNHVDIAAAKELGIKVLRVPSYSPNAIAEHTLALILTLNRKTHKAYNRVREGNFSLEGLMGFDLVGKTAGIIGTGKIGALVCKILQGFGCQVLAYDPFVNKACENSGVKYVALDEIFKQSDIVSLHCPLTSTTQHVVNSKRLEFAKKGMMLINTGRGALVDTRAVIDSLKSGKLGYLGLDVYEEEADLFFDDLSNKVITDDVFSRLLTFPNVLITGHQAFFTNEAVNNIIHTTLKNIEAYKNSKELVNEVK